MNMNRTLVIALVLLAGASVVAQDWPHFLGPERDGRYTGPPLNIDWPESGPPEVWRRSVGEGFAGPVVAGDRLILFHREDGREIIEALDTDTGDELWRYDYRTTYRDDFGFDEGPRSAPVVEDGRVFTFGAQGQIHALSLETGEVLWSVDAKDRFDFPKGFFGAAGSPLVQDGRVIANIGGDDGGIVAFDAETGDVLWVSTDDEASYSSGVAAVFDGIPHAVFLTRNHLVGLDPTDGAIRFSVPWQARIRSSVNVATPIIIDDHIFISAEYGPGAGLFRVANGQLEEQWTSNNVMSNHYATSVHHEGLLYGYHGRQEYGPSFRAVDLFTGAVRWEVEDFGAGTVTLAGDILLIMRESGELWIVEASGEALMRARAQILPPTVRAYPALAHGRLYVRNEDTLVSLDLRP